MPRTILLSLLLALGVVVTPASGQLQDHAPPRWEASLPPATAAQTPAFEADSSAWFAGELDSAGVKRSHTVTGLLVGGLVGIAAAGAFLAGFCSPHDSPCQGDEYARAGFYIALPITLAGGLIGTLVRTEH